MDDIIDAPKTDYFIKLNDKADMPTVLSAFYRWDKIGRAHV